MSKQTKSLWTKLFGSTTKTVVVGDAGPSASTIWVGVPHALIGEHNGPRVRANVSSPNQRAAGMICFMAGLVVRNEAEATELAPTNDLRLHNRTGDEASVPMDLSRVLRGAEIQIADMTKRIAVARTTAEAAELQKELQEKQLIAAACRTGLAAGQSKVDCKVRIKIDRKVEGFKKVDLLEKEVKADKTKHRTSWYGIEGQYDPRCHHSRAPKDGSNPAGLYWEFKVSRVVTATGFIFERTRYVDPYGDAPIFVSGNPGGAPKDSRVVSGTKVPDAITEAQKKVFADLGDD